MVVLLNLNARLHFRDHVFVERRTKNRGREDMSTTKTRFCHSQQKETDNATRNDYAPIREQPLKCL